MNEPVHSERATEATPTESRRDFLSVFSFLAMIAGLASGYGYFAALAVRFLFPSGPSPRRWLYVSDLSSFAVGDSIPFRTPSGHLITITRTGEADSSESFIALSSICPHLGCSVHWEGQNNRFFCPCHNGVFDPGGNAVSGPPADARPPQNLERYPLRIENGLLEIQVSTFSLAEANRNAETDLAWIYVKPDFSPRSHGDTEKAFS